MGGWPDNDEEFLPDYETPSPLQTPEALSPPAEHFDPFDSAAIAEGLAEGSVADENGTLSLNPVDEQMTDSSFPEDEPSPGRMDRWGDPCPILPCALHPEYFGDGEDERDDWIVSVTTLGTPHRGTTIINALDRFISRSRQQAVSLVARLFAAASFYPAEKRAYDLQLDHWGIRRKTGETFQDMLLRLESVDGPVWKWLTSNHNGFYDNSIEGVHDLSHKAINTSGKVYYFSLSFHATVPFPEDWPTWGLDAIDSFPTRLEDFVRGATRNIPIVPWVVDGLIGIITGAGWSFLTTVTSFRSFVEWITDAVITRISRDLGYDLVFPKPGRYIPRKDVIPIMLLSVYAMGGQDLTQMQKNILGVNQEDWYQNDGVVNTESMRGPLNSARGISSLPDFDFSIPGKKGIYWHLGDNDQMDHADEIGVFIEQNTVRLQIPCR
ncbi:lipase [Penicillium sp. IBT 16267x]|nr:lipase [Penicillium sp. IBT 16267x]